MGLSLKASQGNREPKAPSAPRGLMDTFITEQSETPPHMPAASLYRAYEQEYHTRGLIPRAARAFYERLKQRATPQQTEAREGARANTFHLRTKGGKRRQESSDLAHYQKA